MTSHYPKFRLTLDEPYDFAKEPGFHRSIHCHDFREDALSLVENTWRCPVTGLVFLRPSWLNEDYNAHFEPLASWTAQTELWETAKRSLDEISSSVSSAGLLSSAVPDLNSPIDWQVTTTAAVLSLASLAESDELQWALESSFTLGEDEGFVLHANKLTDSMRRHKNWLAIGWDNLQVHIRPSGQVAIYRWADRGDKSDTATLELIEEVFLSSPGEMADKDTYFLFLPIPSRGLLIYSSHTPQRMASKISSARAGAVKGALIEIPSEDRPDSEGDFRLTRASKIAIALTKTPRAAHVLGFHRLRFPLAGTYLDATFSFPYTPLVAPSVVNAVPLPTGRGSLTGTLVNTDNTALWAAGERQARIKAVFANAGGGVYTPFLLATDVVFPRVMTTRDTTPLRLTNTGGTWSPGTVDEAATLDLLQSLEFSEDDTGRIEGKASVYGKSDHLKAILQRGDATWKLEFLADADEATEWATISGGIARWEEGVSVEPYDSGTDSAVGFGRGTRRRMAYKATLQLSDMWSRFGEIHATQQGALDGLTIGQAINRVLQTSGFAALGGTIPPEMDSITLPQVPKGENWRHGIQEGDEGGSILRQLLLYPRKQLTQFRMLYDWDAAEWTCEKLSKLTGVDAIYWWFTPDQREAWGLDNPDGAPDPEFRIEYLSGFTFRPRPPEANVVRPFGIEKPGADGKRVPGQPLQNKASLEDTESRDYLGRAIVATPVLAPLSDELTVSRFGRMVYEQIAHRRIGISIPASGYEPLLHPGTLCDVRSFNEAGELATLFQGWWLRRKTTTVDYVGQGDIPQTIYVLDEMWDMPLD